MSRRARSQAFALRQLDLGTSKEYISMSSCHFVFFFVMAGAAKKATPSTFSWTDDEAETTETNSLTFLLLLLRRYEFVLGSYLVRDHV